MSVGALFSSWYYESGLQGNQDWLKIFFPPVWECGLIVLWKTTKNNVFRMRPSLGKNSKFDLLGWLNECRDPFLIVIILMWTSRQWKPPFVCFWLFSESFFPVVFNHETLFWNGVVGFRRLCHNDSGEISQRSEISLDTASPPKIHVFYSETRFSSPLDPPISVICFCVIDVGLPYILF